MKKAGIKNYIEITRTAVGEVEHADTDEDEENAGNGDIVGGLKDVASE
jgi:hypothetical protein